MTKKPAKAPVKAKKKPAPGGRAHKNRPQTHRPTEQSRAAVQALSAIGTPPDEICRYLTHMMQGLECKSENTLRKHYAHELGLAKTHQRLVVSQNFYRKCAGAPAVFDVQGNKVRDEVKTETVAQIFWLKAQAGWKDRQFVEIDPDQKPIPVSIDSLTDRQLEELEARLLNKLGKKPTG